ncbi:MAG TPA: zf-TFIIB domain-containing protein [Thermoanaerobaculia bacterium]|nr:zf-TFIIB domain-containing protein [Thermoanaerobaculia bacterium]
MQCPRCRVELERRNVRGRATEVDRCAKCGGVWFDDGEIEQVIGVPRRPRLAVPANARRTANETCPHCAEPLFVFAYPGTMTIVDACRRCAGIWLDSGELEEIHRATAGRRMECPKCGHEQPSAESCAQCGVVIRKAAAAPPPARTQAPPQPLHDEIPGVKGALIRFIDWSLDSIVTGVKRR